MIGAIVTTNATMMTAAKRIRTPFAITNVAETPTKRGKNNVFERSQHDSPRDIRIKLRRLAADRTPHRPKNISPRVSE